MLECGKIWSWGRRTLVLSLTTSSPVIFSPPPLFSIFFALLFLWSPYTFCPFVHLLIGFFSSSSSFIGLTNSFLTIQRPSKRGCSSSGPRHPLFMGYYSSFSLLLPCILPKIENIFRRACGKRKDPPDAAEFAAKDAIPLPGYLYSPRFDIIFYWQYNRENISVTCSMFFVRPLFFHHDNFQQNPVISGWRVSSNRYFYFPGSYCSHKFCFLIFQQR